MDIADRGNELMELHERIEELESRKQTQIKQASDSPPPPEETSKTEIAQEEEKTSITISQVTDLSEVVEMLRAENESLRDEASRAVQLQSALSHRDAEMKEKEKEIKELEEKGREAERTVDGLLAQIDHYRSSAEESERMFKEEVEAMKKDLEFYRERYTMVTLNQSKVEELVIAQEREITELKGTLEKYEEGQYGLGEAVTRINEYRSMVELRDKHIAELVTQLNTLDLLLTAVMKQAGMPKDMDAFIASLDLTAARADDVMMRKAREDLEAKVRMMREVDPGTITIEVEERERRPLTLEDRPKREAEAKPKLKPRKKSGQFKPAETSEKLIVATQLLDLYLSTAQAVDEYHEEVPQEEGKGTELREENKMLHKENMQLHKENMSLREQLRQRPYVAVPQSVKWAIQTTQEVSSPAKIVPKETPQEIVTKETISPSPSDTTPIMSISSSSSADGPTLTISSAAAVAEDSLAVIAPAEVERAKLSLSIPEVGWYRFKPELELVSVGESIVVLPTEEEKAVAEAERNALQRELSALQEKASMLEQEVESARETIKQRDEQLVQLNEVAQGLAAKLKGERAAFKEKLLEMRNESEIYIKQKLAEAEEARAMESKSGLSEERGASGREESLREVFERVQSLSEERGRLMDEVSMIRASASISAREAAAFKQRVRELEEEKEKRAQQQQERGEGDAGELSAYSAKVGMRCKKAEQRVRELEQEVRELKMRKPVRDPFMHSLAESSASSSAAADESEAKAAAQQLKQAQSRNIRLQEMNEDLQEKLQKATATIDRLNMLLQRRETSMMRMHEQSLKMRESVPAMPSQHQQQQLQQQKARTSPRPIPLRSMRDAPVRVSRV